MTRLFADARGIFRSDEGEPDLGMRWEAIAAVTMHMVHDGKRAVLVIELDDAQGETFVIADGLPGFDAALDALRQHLPALGESLREAQQSDTPMSDPRELWRRS